MVEEQESKCIQLKKVFGGGGSDHGGLECQVRVIIKFAEAVRRLLKIFPSQGLSQNPLLKDSLAA